MLDAQLIQRAIQRIAEERIQDAEKRGLFDNLPGQGKPLKHLDDGPESSHLMNWARGLIEREQLMMRGLSSPRPLGETRP